jgi:hypothetical protein
LPLSSVPSSTAPRQSPLRTGLTVVPAPREDQLGRRWQDASSGVPSYVPFPAFPGPPLEHPSFPLPSAPIPNEKPATTVASGG